MPNVALILLNSLIYLSNLNSNLKATVGILPFRIIKAKWYIGNNFNFSFWLLTESNSAYAFDKSNFTFYNSNYDFR